ncbi:hypothetical protein Tco_0486473 [Tanacetum coccineum]
MIQINDLDNRLQKAGQTDQTLRMLLPKEDNVNTGKQGLVFKNQNDDVNLSLLNKAKELAPCLYSIDEMGKDERSDRKIFSEEELKSKAKNSYEQNINTRVRNRLSDEFEHLVKNVNLQLNYFEKSLVKEMKDDLKYVMTLEDEFVEHRILKLEILSRRFFQIELPDHRYQDYQDKDCQGRLLDRFQDDIKYEHVGPKIQDRKKAKHYKYDQAARDLHKSYEDVRRKPLELQVGDKVMLKVSPWKGVIRFRKRGRLNPRYIVPFKPLAKIGSISYQFDLPQELSGIHNTFHVSNLKKCLLDETLVIPLEEIQVDDKLHSL